MNKEEQDELILKSVLWGARFAESVHTVGGYGPAVLTQFSSESITTMVRNGLSVKAEK